MINSKTRKKIEFLQQYITKNAGVWYDQFGDNVSSVRVDKKIKKRKKTRFYSIVFHVVKKKPKSQIISSEVIPDKLSIAFPDGKTRKIKTDVKETGEFKFHSHLLDPIRDIPTGETGTLGLFLTDARGNVFALTNYHVAARQLMRDGRFFYDVAAGHPRYDVVVSGFTGRLFTGMFNQEIDAAFVSLGPNTSASNTMPDGTKVENRVFIRGPIDASFRGLMVKVYLRSRGGRIGRTVTDNSAPLSSRLMQFVDLITVRTCGTDGDSGGPVLDGNNQLLGIILGSDNDSTYIIPYFKIHHFFPLQIL